MWRLICCFISVQLLSSEIHAESKFLAENGHDKNETQIFLEPVIETTNGRVILISKGAWPESSADVDPNSAEGLEIRGNGEGCCAGLYSSFTSRRNWNPTLSPEYQPNPVPAFNHQTQERDSEGNLIPPWTTDAWKRRMDAAYMPPSLAFRRKEKGRKFLHTIEPLLHMCCCCCIAHWCD